MLLSSLVYNLYDPPQALKNSHPDQLLTSCMYPPKKHILINNCFPLDIVWNGEKIEADAMENRQEKHQIISETHIRFSLLKFSQCFTVTVRNKCWKKETFLAPCPLGDGVQMFKCRPEMSTVVFFYLLSESY